MSLEYREVVWFGYINVKRFVFRFMRLLGEWGCIEKRWCLRIFWGILSYKLDKWEKVRKEDWDGLVVR